MLRPAHLGLTAVVAILGATAPCIAGGGDVFVNGVNPTEFGWNSNINGVAQQAADDFLLAADATVNHVTWYGFDHTGPLSNNFTVRIFNFDGGLGTPEATPFYEAPLGLVNGTDTGLVNGSGFAILEYSADIPDVALSGGLEYWLTIASTDATTWAWSHSDPVVAPDTQYHREGDAGAWRNLRTLGFPDSRLDQAFTLTAAAECPCPEDIDRDGRVAFSDILRILGEWGDCPEQESSGPGGGIEPNGIRTILLRRSDNNGTPVNVAYHAGFDRYYASNAGFVTASAYVYDAAGNLLQTQNPINIDVRSWNFIPSAGRLEIVTFNALNGNGGGDQGLVLPGVDGGGLLDGSVVNLLASMPGNVSSQTGPAYDPMLDVFYGRDSTELVHVVRRSDGSFVSAFNLDFAAAGVTGIDIAQYAMGFDEVGRCLVVADATNDRALVFALDGSYLGASQLDVDVQNLVQMGYTNGQMFAFDPAQDGWQGYIIKRTGPCDRPCPEDIDRDGRVAFSDILRVLGAWGPCVGDQCDMPFMCGGDPTYCDEAETCLCVSLFDGTNVCVASTADCAGACPDGTCPPGFKCVTNTCCGDTICVADADFDACDNAVTGTTPSGPGPATGPLLTGKASR